MIFTVVIVVALIGDLVGSRKADDRAALNEVLTDAIGQINAAFAPVTPLRITVGDEYQGAFATLGAALRATLRLRLALHPYDVRHGLARGEVQVLSDEPRVEDGPAWWAARTSIEAAAEAARHAASRTVRTVVGGEPAVNAALVLRDELVARMDDRDVSVLSGMIAGMTQDEIALRLGISASAVSQRTRRSGLAAVLRADRLLGELT
jgi:hypothetical protein